DLGAVRVDLVAVLVAHLVQSARRGRWRTGFCSGSAGRRRPGYSRAQFGLAWREPVTQVPHPEA
ncbi:MAG: hypothetical protein M3Y49_16155, partial [Actinomycetota bacterium]|nr:hypothetical protein [Actinomycetota bacterium]